MRALRDATVAALNASPAFQGTVKASRQTPTTGLPSTSVFMRRRSGQSDGAANTGTPLFVDRAIIALSMLVRDDDAADEAVEAALSSLLEDVDWLATVEGVEDYDVEYKDQGDETTADFIEVVLEITVRLGRIEFAINPVDDLETTRITVPHGGAADIQIDTQQD